MSRAHPPELSEAVLARAAERGELFLMYQPKLDLRTGRIAGVEALARWHHPRRGHIEPSIFIPAAEGGGLIDWFTEWALEAAIRQWSAWREEGLELDLAVNISAMNLQHLGLPDRVRTLCSSYEVPPERLMLELTESATQEASRLMDTTARFRLKGIGISLDDFGTGYGSLVQLRSLPFTELKIDRSFVADLLVSRESRAITRGLVTMAHEIGLSVTAEGVEDQSTLEALAAFGCDYAQGYLIARPMAGDRLHLWVSKWSGAAFASRRQQAEAASTAPAQAQRAAGK